jgi:hypothetical protein
MIKAAAIRGFVCIELICMGLQASTVIVGQPTQIGTGSCDPFGCPEFLGLGTYQQVYLSSAFPGSITIDELTFFDEQVHNLGHPSTSTYDLVFSYTSKAPGALDLSNPNNNIGSDSQTFFTGALPALISIGPGQRTMNLTGAPFTYDPSLGNLMLTITLPPNPADGSPPLFLDRAQTIAQTSNAYFPITGGGFGNDQGGLVTEFTFTASTVPEPGSLLLIVAGATLMALKGRACRPV